jgi:hypothetical protein
LISEDTLRTFFAPFGDIHYVCITHALSQIHSDDVDISGQSSCRKALRVCSICTQGRC